MKKHKVLELFDNQLFTETEHLYRGSGSKYTWTNKITEDKNKPYPFLNAGTVKKKSIKFIKIKIK